MERVFGRFRGWFPSISLIRVNRPEIDGLLDGAQARSVAVNVGQRRCNAGLTLFKRKSLHLSYRKTTVFRPVLAYGLKHRCTGPKHARQTVLDCFDRRKSSTEPFPTPKWRLVT
jgi:hypothetical protein